MKWWCSGCGRRLSDDEEVILDWGETCPDPPEHRHLAVASSCCQTAIIDRPPTWMDRRAREPVVAGGAS